MAIQFLSIEEIITIHNALIDRFGGLTGIRDKNLLESAIYQPQIAIQGEFVYQSLYAMAAAYAYGIIKNHAFLDGNKRTGMVATVLFLKRNNIEITLTNEEFFSLAIDIATSKVSLEKLAEILVHSSSK